MRSKENKNNLTADEVIDSIYDYFKDYYPSYVFSKNSSYKDLLYSYYYSYEQRRYVVGMEYSDFLYVGDFLIAKGVGFGDRFDSPGSCLLIIPINKSGKVEDVIADPSCIKTYSYSKLFSYWNKLHSLDKPMDVVSEINYVLNCSDSSFSPHSDNERPKYYISMVDRYGADFTNRLIVAFECYLGINNQETVALTNKTEEAAMKLSMEKFPKLKVYQQINSLIETLKCRVDEFGESEFTPTIEFLFNEIANLRRADYRK